jgi:hypothetical protein
MVVGRRCGPYSDSTPGHLISSLVTKHFARLLVVKFTVRANAFEGIHALVKFQLHQSRVVI